MAARPGTALQVDGDLAWQVTVDASAGRLGLLIGGACLDPPSPTTTSSTRKLDMVANALMMFNSGPFARRREGGMTASDHDRTQSATRLARHPLLWFIVLAYAMSWICWLPLLADRQDWVDWSASPYLHLLGGLGPGRRRRSS